MLQSQKGYNLIQLMLSMTLGLIVVVMGVAVYQKMSRHYDRTVEVLEHHSQALAVNELLTRLVDQAGVHSRYGTQAWQQKIFSGEMQPTLFGLNYPMVYAQNFPLINDNYLNLADPNSDILMLQVVDEVTYAHQVILPSEAVEIDLDEGLDLAFQKGRYVLLGDGYKSLLAIAEEDANTEKLILKDPLAVGLNAPIMIASGYRIVILYIRNTERLDIQGQPIYALYQRIIYGPSRSTTQELVAGVTSMQVEVFLDGEWQRVSSDLPRSAWDGDIHGLRVSYQIDGKTYQSVIALKGVSHAS